MNVITRRRLRRLQKLVASVLAERKRRAPQQAAWLRQAALDHATKLVILILHGDPHIDEPLAIAWNRALDRLGLSDAPQPVSPYSLRGVVDALPGDTEIAKIARVISSAPSWLLNFCHAAVDCYILGIDFPKSSEPAPEYGRDGLRDREWPQLPTGTIGAGAPMPKDNRMFALTFEERMDWIRLLELGEKNYLRRDRRRFNEILDKMNGERTSRKRLVGPPLARVFPRWRQFGRGSAVYLSAGD